MVRNAFATSSRFAQVSAKSVLRLKRKSSDCLACEDLAATPTDVIAATEPQQTANRKAYIQDVMSAPYM